MRNLPIHFVVTGLLSTPLWLPMPALAQIQFTDVGSAAGLSSHQYSSPTAHSLGVNWIDIDLDGWPDLFAVGGAADTPPHLYRNNGDGTFSPRQDLLPVLPAVEMSGSVYADYDRDGDLDIYIYTDNVDFVLDSEHHNLDGPANLLLRNLYADNGGLPAPGTPLFQEVAAAAGVDDLPPVAFGPLPGYRSKTAAWLDYDRDGCIDLFVGHLVMNEGGHTANRDRLYRNRCDGTFEDVTASAGINDDSDATTYRSALAVGGFHLNDDLWPDLFVVNVSHNDPQPYLNDQIFFNQGRGADGQVTLTEVTGTMPGVGDDAQAGMGIDVADFDLDGDWDVYITDFYQTTQDEPPLGNVLYLGGPAGFADNSAVVSGVEGRTSWGIAFFDADHDGWEDLYVNRFNVDFMFRNPGPNAQGLVEFETVAGGAGIATGNTRGSAMADYDRDGDLDLAAVNQGGPLQLFRNDSQNQGHWLMLELEGSRSSLDAIGTVIEAEVDGIVRKRQVKGGSSAHSQDALAVHFGFGDADQVDRLTIRWLSGETTVLLNVGVDQYLQVREPVLFFDGFESGDLGSWASSSSGSNR